MKPHKHPNFSEVLKMATETYAELRGADVKVVAQRMLDGDETTTKHVLMLMEAVA